MKSNLSYGATNLLSTLSKALILLAFTAVPAISQASVIYTFMATNTASGGTTSLKGSVTTSSSTGYLSSIATNFSITGSINGNSVSISGTSVTGGSTDALYANGTTVEWRPTYTSSTLYTTVFNDATSGYIDFNFYPSSTYPYSVTYSNYDISSGNLTTYNSQQFDPIRITAVPVPPTAPLVVIGLAALLVVRKGKRAKKRKANQTFNPSPTPALPA